MFYLFTAIPLLLTSFNSSNSLTLFAKSSILDVCRVLNMPLIKYLDTQPAITCSKLAIETLEKVMKYVQS